MATRYPCPNPTCIHEFDASQLAGAASLTCPVCGMVLQLRAAPATPPATVSSVPMAQPVTAVPMASPVTAAPPAPVPATGSIPRALPATPAPDTTPVFADNAPIVRSTRAPKRSDWLTYSAVIGGFVLLVGFGIGAYMVGFRGGTVGDTTFAPMRNSDYNIQFQSPGKPWLNHEGLRARLPASLLAMHRENPSAWMAIDARRFDHDLAPRELSEEAHRKLGAYFRNVEATPPRHSPPKEGDPVANQPTFRFVFTGDMVLRENEFGEQQVERVAGECVMFRFQGIGYWVYSWMPTEVTKDEAAKNQIAAQFAELRRRISLLGDRAEWKQQQQKRTVFAGKSTDYQLVDRMGRWQVFENEDPKDHDANADIVLAAPAPTARNIIQRRQTSKWLVVLLLPAAKDGVTSARQYLLEKYRKESETASVDAADEGTEPANMANEPNGKLVKWRVTLQGRSVFVVAGIAPREKELIVAYAECDWNERNANEVLFQSMVASLQKKSE